MTTIPTNYNFTNDISRFRYLEKLDITPEKPDAKAKASAERFVLRRNRLTHKESTQDKIQAFAGALLGTVAMMAALMKHQKIKNPLKLKYELGEMIALSAAPIVGGVSLGMIGNEGNANLAKSREGVFQILNAAIPTWLSGASLRLCETSKGLNNIPAKIISLAVSLLTGMHGAAVLSNQISDPKDKHPDRKLTMRDSLANIDDMVGVFVLAKFPLASKLQISKILPSIYSYCGFRAGKSN